MSDTLKPSRDIARLVEIMAALRAPGTGCPWDLEQTFETIAPYTIEEAYEVADAIGRGDLADLEQELGDLLLQVVYHARMAEEQGAFDFGDVIQAITAKMIRRHPHVFGTAAERAAGAQPGFWKRIKAEEAAEKKAESARLGAAPSGDASRPPRQSSGLLAGVPVALPALTRAVKLQDVAAKVGFDWPSLAPVFAKLKEEIEELEEAAPGASLEAASDAPPAASGRLAGGESEAAIKEELGDILFVLANVARHLKVDPEEALRGANEKFCRRFQHIETRLGELGRTPEQSTLEEMDRFWDEARAADKR